MTASDGDLQISAVTAMRKRDVSCMVRADYRLEIYVNCWPAFLLLAAALVEI